MKKTTEVEKKINITKEIVKRLNNLGYAGEINILIQYYIRENIKYIFGTEEVSENDIEFITRNNQLEIKSIYSDQTYCISAGHKNDYDADFIRCDRESKENEQPYTEFEIVNSGTNCRSTLTLSAASTEESLRVKTLEHDVEDNRFTLTYWDVADNRSETYYKASLTPINAKNKNKDWFSYNREVPLVTDGESLLKRLHDEFKGIGANRVLVTSYDIEDLINYAPVIYGELKADAARVLKKSFEEKDPEQGAQKKFI